MIMYKTGGFSEKLIEEVEIVKKTDKTVILKNGRRCNISSSYDCYWDSIDEAKSHLKQKYESQLKNALNQVEYANKRLAQLEKY